MSSLRKSRLVAEAADQQLLVGTQQVLSKLGTMTIASQSLAPADVIAILQGVIDSSQAVRAATAARTAAVKADRSKRMQAAPLLKAFKRIVQGMFSESPDVLATFGLEPVKVGATTIATKAAALDKTIATRKARHTMGPVQKKKIHGAPPGAITGSPPAPASVATAATAATPSPVVATGPAKGALTGP